MILHFLVGSLFREGPLHGIAVEEHIANHQTHSQDARQNFYHHMVFHPDRGSLNGIPRLVQLSGQGPQTPKDAEVEHQNHPAQEQGHVSNLLKRQPTDDGIPQEQSKGTGGSRLQPGLFPHCPEPQPEAEQLHQIHRHPRDGIPH